MRIGIYGGAFNPVHNGHINLARKAKERLTLDKILFIPTAVPPHKTDDEFASRQDRYNMLALAIEDIDGAEISCMEFERGGKSYTYDTLVELKRIYPDDELFLIIGSDQLMSFHLWYRSGDILSMVSLCAGVRENEEEKHQMLHYAQNLDGLDYDRFYLFQFPAVRVSSSDIRQRIKNGMDISGLIPQKVYKYIIEKRLYRV